MFTVIFSLGCIVYMGWAESCAFVLKASIHIHQADKFRARYSEPVKTDGNAMTLTILHQQCEDSGVLHVMIALFTKDSSCFCLQPIYSGPRQLSCF